MGDMTKLYNKESIHNHWFYFKFRLWLAFLTIVLVGVYGNTSIKAEAAVKEPTYSVTGGFFTEEFTLELNTDIKNASIYYTFDGSEPYVGNPTTYKYSTPIHITYDPIRENKSPFFCGTIVRSMVMTDAGEVSKISTHTYFVDKNIHTKYQLPIISIATDDANLNDPNIGIMSIGNTGKKGKDWERPIHIEYFDEKGNRQFAMNAGIRLHGAASREWVFKSFRIYARAEYDTVKKFKYDFFSESFIPALVKSGDKNGKPITEFKRLLLRNGGNEGTAWDGTLIRDAFTQALMVNTNLDLQAYRPAITFLNGEFYGIQNIRERQDEKYISAHYDVDEKDVVIYDFAYDPNGYHVINISAGEDDDKEFYQNLVDFIRNNDLSIQENYEKVKEWMDIENFVDYQIVNIYGCNRDWPGNNSKAWRIRTEYNPNAEYGHDGRIRWLVFDLDFSFGLYNPSAVNQDYLAAATMEGGKSWPTQDGSTLFLRSLLKNEEFRTYFAQRFLDLLNTNFDAETAKALLDQMAAPYQASIQEFRERFKTMGDWNENLQGVKSFIDKRGAISKSHLANKLNLGKFYFLRLNFRDDQSNIIPGKIQINTVTIDPASVTEGVWKKSYYDGIPTVLTAIPNEGYEFVSWSGASDSKEATINASDLIKDSELALAPIFELKAEKSKGAFDNNNKTEVNLDSSQKDWKENDIFLIMLCILFLSLVIIGLIIYRVLHNRKGSM